MLVDKCIMVMGRYIMIIGIKGMKMKYKLVVTREGAEGNQSYKVKSYPA